VVVLLSARADVVPSALLLLEIQTRGVGQEDDGQEVAEGEEPVAEETGEDSKAETEGDADSAKDGENHEKEAGDNVEDEAPIARKKSKMRRVIGDDE